MLDLSHALTIGLRPQRGRRSGSAKATTSSSSSSTPIVSGAGGAGGKSSNHTAPLAFALTGASEGNGKDNSHSNSSRRPMAKTINQRIQQTGR